MTEDETQTQTQTETQTQTVVRPRSVTFSMIDLNDCRVKGGGLCSPESTYEPRERFRAEGTLVQTRERVGGAGACTKAAAPPSGCTKQQHLRVR